MKHLIFSLLFGCTFTIAFSQDLKTVKSDLDKKQVDKAKTDIDAYVAKSPDDAEGLYYKSKIYQQVADAAQYKTVDNIDAGQEAFTAFKKAMGDGKDPKIALVAIKDQYSPVFNLYTGYYQAGANAFNTAATSGNKANFEDAMNLFMKSDNVGHYIFENKWSKIAEVDTVLVLNIGKSALNAGKNDITETYFKKLVDAKITGTKDGTDNSAFELPYQWFALHYKEAGDEANMNKYISLGKELFPKDDYYDLVLMDYYREKKNYPSLFKAHDEYSVRQPDSLHTHLDYASDIFNYVYNSDEGVVVNNKDSLLNTLHTELEKSSKISPDNVSTNILFAQYYYNVGVEQLNDAAKIKSAKPDDVKKKDDLNAKAKANLNGAVPYADKVLTSLEQDPKKTNKSRYKSIVNLMQQIYQSLGQNDKVKLYQDKYDKADTKFIN